MDMVSGTPVSWFGAFEFGGRGAERIFFEDRVDPSRDFGEDRLVMGE
jgi:hypothetical protein